MYCVSGFRFFLSLPSTPYPLTPLLVVLADAAADCLA